jgi:hypothetical protein
MIDSDNVFFSQLVNWIEKIQDWLLALFQQRMHSFSRT